MAGRSHVEIFRELETPPLKPDPGGRYPERVEVTERWWWRLQSANGEIISRSSESYRDITDARRAVDDFFETAMAARAAPIEVNAT